MTDVTVAAHQPDFGVQFPDGKDKAMARFRLWAPQARSVVLEIADGEAVPMRACDGGWHETTVVASPGTAYHFLADVSGNGDLLKFPDPAAHAQADDVHGDSVVVDPASYAWRNPEWQGRPWHETVIYELHVGACGGFAGVTAKLEALAKLGITAVELMPVNDFPGPRNWGYDGVLPYAPDAAYGTPDELKALVDAAHGLKLMVFLDVVYNHFGPDGNYLGAYAPQFFRDDIHTPWGQAIDFRHAEVREFFIQNTLYWLREYRFDGLRFDAVHEIHEPDFMPALAERVRAAMPPGRHVHLMLENDRNDAALLKAGFDAQWNDDGHHVLHLLLTGEDHGYYADYRDATMDKLARCLTQGFVYQGEPSPHREGRPRGMPSSDLPSTAFIVFLQNHDQIGNRAFGDRLTTLTEPRALRAAYALLLLAPHIPMLFMGEEKGSKEPFQFFAAHRSEELAKAVREGRRKEFKSFPQFSAPGAENAIPDPGAEKTFLDSIVKQDDTPHAREWLSLTRELLALRHAHIVPRLAHARGLDAVVLGPKAISARWKLGDGSVLAIALNLGAESVDIDPTLSDQLLDREQLYALEDTLKYLADRNQLPAHGFIAALTVAPEVKVAA